MAKVNKLLDLWFPNYTCVTCGAEIQNSANAYICDECIDKLPFNVDMTEIHFAPFLYEEPIRSLILKLKYSDNAFCARAIAPYMAAVYIKHIKNKKNHIIIPVPLCKERYKERGYNQSELLANEVGEYLGLPVISNILIRIKKTAPQKKMTLEQRLENIKNAFDVHNAEAIKGKDILLIDDVFTTGATANECIKILKKFKAKSVKLLAIASASL